ncbi:hypothetical protein B0H67DRAFT_442504, partial [Lasiosphaeris hirsuta]
PRPPAWLETWPWPANPTRIPDSERQCDFCRKPGCSCINRLLYPKPRPTPQIKSFPEGRLGLQAVASEPGQIAYRVGDPIGCLYGEIAPLGAYDNEQTIEFVKPRHTEENAVCRIRRGDVGNLFWFLNHSHKPLARFLQTRVSGRWVMEIRAFQDIYDGSEINI